MVLGVGLAPAVVVREAAHRTLLNYSVPYVCARVAEHATAAGVRQNVFSSLLGCTWPLELLLWPKKAKLAKKVRLREMTNKTGFFRGTKTQCNRH